jgi:hypothetical protein
MDRVRNTELTAERDRLTRELDDLHDGVRAIEMVRLAATTAGPPAQQPVLSRAERRRLEREQQRRRGR